LQKRNASSPAAKVETKTVEKFVLKDGQLAKLMKLYERIFNEAERHASMIKLFWEQQSEEAKAMLGVLQLVVQGPAPVVPMSRPSLVQKPAAPSRPAQPARPAREVAREVAESNGNLGKCERAILTVLAQEPDGCTSGKLTLLTRYRYSGGFKNSLSTLRQAGYMAGENTGIMRITEDGLAAIGPVEPRPTGADLARYWLEHPSFGKCERAILGALLEHPHGLTAEKLCEITNYQYSGGFKNSLSELRTAGVLVGKNTDVMQASEELFS